MQMPSWYVCVLCKLSVKQTIFLILFNHAMGFSLRKGVGKKPKTVEWEDLSLQLFVMGFPPLLDTALVVLLLLKSLHVGDNRIPR